MKARFCKVCGKLLTTGEHGDTCWKHYTQMRRFGKYLDTNSRTYNDPNEFRFIGNDIVEMDTYDKLGNVNYTYKIDADDYPEISKHKWCTALYNNRPYAMEGVSKIKLHRLVTKAKSGSLIDHIDGDSTNNCKNNLRVASKSLNNINIIKDGIEHIGIYQKKSGKWYAAIQWKNKQYISNLYLHKAEAAFARYLLEQMFVKHDIVQNNKDLISTLTTEQKEYVISTINKRFTNY